MDVARDPVILKRKRLRRVAYAIVALLVVAVVSVALARMEPAAPTVDRATLLIDTVKRGPFVRQVRGLGTLVPEEPAVFNIPSPGALTLRASKEGYRLVESTVTVDGTRQTTFHSMMIESVLPPIDLSGVRVLELRADAACSQLPSELRTRTYAVSAVRLDEGYRPYKFYPANGMFKDFLVWAYVSGTMPPSSAAPCATPRTIRSRCLAAEVGSPVAASA